MQIAIPFFVVVAYLVVIPAALLLGVSGWWWLAVAVSPYVMAFGLLGMISLLGRQR